MKLNKTLLTFLVIGFALSNIAIIFSLYSQSLAPTSSSASSDGKLLLKLASPASLTGATNNSNITVDLYAQNTLDATVSEIVLSYDPSVLQATQSSEDSNILLGINKTFSTPGKVTTDIAFIGSGALPENQTLVTFTFKVLNNTKNTSAITVSSESTLGTPNKLSSSGMGSLPINFGGSTAGSGSPAPQTVPPAAHISPPPSTGSTIVPPTGQDSNDTDTDTSTDNTNTDSDTDTITGSDTTDSTTTPTTTSTESVTPSANQPSVMATAPNRNLLIGLLVFTISGTLASMFFLVKELFKKNQIQNHNSNPFM